MAVTGISHNLKPNFKEHNQFERKDTRDPKDRVFELVIL